jgi:outer membrane protein assembly factor BamE (lipoprotein component of BamABCDE complex)
MTRSGDCAQFRKPAFLQFMSRGGRAASGLILAATLVLALPGCAAMETRNGYLPREELIADIKPGVQTQEDVQRILGSPSSTASFEERRNVWYYISNRMERVAFFAPEIVEQDVLAIEFDDDGKVKDVRRYDLEDSREIDLVERQTPTRGRELGFLEQLFGNIGRFAPSQ